MSVNCGDHSALVPYPSGLSTEPLASTAANLADAAAASAPSFAAALALPAFPDVLPMQAPPSAARDHAGGTCLAAAAWAAAHAPGFLDAELPREPPAPRLKPAADEAAHDMDAFPPAFDRPRAAAAAALLGEDPAALGQAPAGDGGRPSSWTPPLDDDETLRRCPLACRAKHDASMLAQDDPGAWPLMSSSLMCSWTVLAPGRGLVCLNFEEANASLQELNLKCFCLV